MELTLIDGAVALIVIISAWLAWSRGFTREALAIGGWVVATMLALYLAPVAEPLIREIPGLGGFLASSCLLAAIAAFAVIMAIALLVLSVFTPLFSAAILESVIGPIDRMFGFLFGIVRGVVLVAVAYLIYDNLSGGADDWPPLANAASRALFDEAATLIDAVRPTELPTWFAERIDALTASCGDPR